MKDGIYNEEIKKANEDEKNSMLHNERYNIPTDNENTDRLKKATCNETKTSEKISAGAAWDNFKLSIFGREVGTVNLQAPQTKNNDRHTLEDGNVRRKVKSIDLIGNEKNNRDSCEVDYKRNVDEREVDSAREADSERKV